MDTGQASGHSKPVTGGFRYTPGTELSSPERVMLRGQNAGSALISALEAEASWWGYVRSVRDSAEAQATADRLSKRYAERARRKPIKELLLACAIAPDQRQAVASMCGLLTAACTVRDEGTARRRTYAMGDAFMLSVLRGAHELAKRGRPVFVARSLG